MQEKNELRKRAKKIRMSLDIENISKKIVEKIKNHSLYIKSEHIMIFYPIGHEVNLLELLRDDKKFYLPRVDGENLLVCPYKNGDKLTLSAFKTQEPVSKPVDSNILDIVFVPALMVDKNNHRLGYGGGFYDKFLSKNAANAAKIVAIPSALMIDKIPAEDFDAMIDLVIKDD